MAVPALFPQSAPKSPLTAVQLALLFLTPLTTRWNEKTLIMYRVPWKQEITLAWQLQA